MNSLRETLGILHQLFLITQWLVIKFILIFWNHKKVKNNILIIPSDTRYLIGAKGDEAMLQAALDRLRVQYPDSEFFIGLESSIDDKRTKKFGVKELSLWGGYLMPIYMCKVLLQLRPHTTLLIGADIMDGYYSSVVSMRMLIASDLASKFKSRAIFLGFSLNSSIKTLVKFSFWLTSKHVKFNLRDPISYCRFNSIFNGKGNLVADTAFLLKPEPLSNEFSELDGWIKKQKRNNLSVVAINFHPMLFKINPKSMVSFSNVLRDLIISEENSLINWILLPHDDRIEAGDIVCLPDFFCQLPETITDRVFLVKNPPSAAQIKYLTKDLDAVITGRMHLAIASLGQGTPVFAFAYQDKFLGLLNHFDLSDNLIFDPDNSSDLNDLRNKLRSFLSNLNVYRSSIKDKLPHVLDLSNRTFADID